MNIQNNYTHERELLLQEQMTEGIRQGKKFADLKKICPETFGLPANWNIESTFKRVVATSFLISHPLRPALRDIATYLEAPYSLILQAWKESMM